MIFRLLLLTGVTGGCALIYQVVWQRYLALLVGSEARSMTLIVALFLGGLAAGYYYWGRWTLQRSSWDRGRMLRAYGYIEIAIAFYGALFPFYFRLLYWLADAIPHSLFGHGVLTFLTIIPPTFLMGATIPMVVRILPETLEQVNDAHAKVYGINTLGACIGCFLAGFVLIHAFGLVPTLLMTSALNFIAGVVFVTNTLSGRMSEVEPSSTDEQHTLPSWVIYTVVAVSGAVVIHLELAMIRLLGLSLGSSVIVFPSMVGLFVLGLAWGSLSAQRVNLTRRWLVVQLVGAFLLLVPVYLSATYWPYWMSHIRVSLTSIPTNYPIFVLLTLLASGLLLLPFLYRMGRVLPGAYGLLAKGVQSFGYRCGLLYFFNALGTLTGAVLLGYGALYWLNLDALIKVDLMLIGVLITLIAWHSQWRFVGSLALVGMLATMLMPQWNRDIHSIGLYRKQTPHDFHFKGFLHEPSMPGKLEYHDDGPNTSVSVRRFRDASPSRSLLVNGKSDGNTIGDYSTMVLLSALPLVYSEANTMRTAVIGLGTGMSAGVLAASPLVAEVDIAEISPKVIEAAALFADANENVLEHKKTQLYELDAFRFFRAEPGPFDIIVSEPSNPWMAGIENLFTPEFFLEAANHLSAKGVFVQWLQLYKTSPAIVHTVIDNLMQAFRHVRFFQIAAADVVMVATNHPLPRIPSRERFAASGIPSYFQSMFIEEPAELAIIDLYGSRELQYMVAQAEHPTHTLFHPSLGHHANLARFIGITVDSYQLLSRDVRRLIRAQPWRIEAFERVRARQRRVNHQCLSQEAGRAIICKRFALLDQARSAVENRGDLRQRSNRDIIELLEQYSRARGEGILKRQPQFLEEVVAEFEVRGKRGFRLSPDDLDELLRAFLDDGMHDGAKKVLTRLLDSNLVSQSEAFKLAIQISISKRKQMEALRTFFHKTNVSS